MICLIVGKSTSIDIDFFGETDEKNPHPINDINPNNVFFHIMCS